MQIRTQTLDAHAVDEGHHFLHLLRQRTLLVWLKMKVQVPDAQGLEPRGIGKRGRGRKSGHAVNG
jgi:hypothetical protein